MDRVELGVNVKTGNGEGIKKLTQDLRLLGAEARTQSQVIDVLAAAIGEEQKAAGNLGRALEAVITGSNKYTDAVRREAAATLLNLGTKSQIANEYLKTASVNDRVALAARRAAEEQEKAAARERRNSEQRARAAERQAERVARAAEREAAARRRAVLQQESDEERLRNRQARALLLPFLGQGAANIGTLPRVGITAASFAAGTPGGSFGQVGLLSEATSVLSAMGTGGIATVVGSLVALQVGKTLLNIAKDAAEAAQELTNFANRLGLGVEEAKKLQIAAQLVDVNFSSLEAGARKLATGLEEPLGAGRMTAEALQKLGIATRDLTGDAREVGPVLLEFLQKLAGTTSETERIRLATLVLGRESRELLPLIKNYDELQRVAERLGATVSRSATEELVKANRAIKEMETSWELMKKSLSAAIAPIVIPIVRKITEVAQIPGQVSQKVDSVSGALSPFRRFGLMGIDSAAADAQGTFEAEKKAAAERTEEALKFRKRMLLTDEGTISRELTEVRKKREELISQLSSELNASDRARLQTDLGAKTREEAILEKRLEGLRKAGKVTNQVKNELDNLLRQVELIEAKAAGVDDNDARRRAEIRKLTSDKATPAQLAAANAFLDRIDAAERRINEQERTRAQQSDRNRLRRESLERELALASIRTRAGFRFDDGVGSEDSIAADYKLALQAAQKFYESAIGDARKLANEKERNFAFDKAAIEFASRNQKAEFDREKALLDLEQRRRVAKEQSEQRTRELIQNSVRSFVSKEADADARLAELNVGFGEGPFGALQAQARRLELARTLYQIELSIASEIKSKSEREYRELQALITLKSSERATEREHEIALAEFRQREIAKVRDDAGRLYDEIFSKGIRGGVTELVNAQVKVIGRTVFQNISQEVFSSGRGFGLNRIFGGESSQVTGDANGFPKLTFLGRLLAGTPFGVDPQKVALEFNSKVTQQNSQATQNLSQDMRRLAATLGGGSAPANGRGLIGLADGGLIGLGGLSDLGDLIIQEKPSGPGDFFRSVLGLGKSNTGAPGYNAVGERKYADEYYGANGVFVPPASSRSNGPFMTAGGRSSLAGGLFNSNASTTDRAVSGFATAGALFAGFQGIYGGIKDGGARGAVSGIGSAAGLAAALDPEPISKAVLTGVAIGSAILKSIFGDPKQKYSNAVDRALQDQRADMPVGSDVVTDLYGNSIDYDLRGRTRVIQKTTMVVQVNALDAQSVLDRSGDIAAALGKELSLGNPNVVPQIQQVAFS